MDRDAQQAVAKRDKRLGGVSLALSVIWFAIAVLGAFPALMGVMMFDSIHLVQSRAAAVLHCAGVVVIMATPLVIGACLFIAGRRRKRGRTLASIQVQLVPLLTFAIGLMLVRLAQWFAA